MLPVKYTGFANSRHSDSEDSMGSFHGQLLNRSSQYVASRKRSPLGRWGTRGPWLSLASWFGRLAAEGAIFAGGAAIGAGVVLYRRGETWNGRPGMVVVVGIACVLVTIMMRMGARLAWKPRPSVSRG